MRPQPLRLQQTSHSPVLECPLKLSVLKEHGPPAGGPSVLQKSGITYEDAPLLHCEVFRIEPDVVINLLFAQIPLCDRCAPCRRFTGELNVPPSGQT